MDLNNLNNNQRAAVESEAKKKAIVAGPGSGKTHVITYIIATDIERGIEPESMAAITFTRNSAKELSERLERLIGPDALNINTSTIHAFCLDILDDYIERLDWEEEFNLYDQSDKEDIINSIIKTQNSKLTYEKYIKALENKEDVYGLETITKEYREKLQMYNAIDLDMILTLTVEVLSKYPDALDEVRKKYKSFYIDEFQDTNEPQLEIIKLINSENLVVIGDPDQSIYEWNKAKPEYMINISSIFPDIEMHKLVDNYRSTKNIVDLANRVIRNNVDRIDKELIATREGEEPDVNYFMDETDELTYILDHLDNNYSNNAIICRNNKRAKFAADFLTHRDIPVNLISSSADVFKKGEIKNLIKLMQLVQNPHDDYAYLRSVNWPEKRITPKDKLNIEAMAAVDMRSYYDSSKSLNNDVLKRFNTNIDKLHSTHKEKSVYGFLSSITDTFNILSSYTEKNRHTRIAEYEQFRKEVRRWEIIQGYLRRPTTLISFLRYVKLRDVQENIKKEREAVNIMTAHGSKGLEFGTVFIPGLNYREFPSGMSKNIEEERRLFFVAMTRAKNELHLTRANSKQINKHYDQATVPSMFLLETGLLIENERMI